MRSHFDQDSKDGYRDYQGTIPVLVNYSDPPPAARPPERRRRSAPGGSSYIAAAAAHQDAMDRLRELTDRLEAEFGPVSAEEEQTALERIATVDDWHDERRSPGAAA
ncbi:hypothetical protein ACFYSH_24050 [Streptomyces sp. NPDC005791]|uniref:hypothetical protein n=1 Tax=Streptomyces sp. NPDC005791 TaxID=3364732 RepID=UPI003692D6ED